MKVPPAIEIVLIDVDVWSPHLERWEAANRALSSEDVIRGETFASSQERRKWRAAHILLRQALTALAGMAMPTGGQRLTRDEGGRPRVAGSDVSISLAHSGRFAAIALGCDGPLGIDVEDRQRAVGMRPDRALRVVRAARALWSATADDHELAFLDAWVRLEALAKARGGGLWRLLSETGVHGRDAAVDEIERRASEAMRADGLAVHSIEVGALDCAAAIARPVDCRIAAVHYTPPL